MVYRKPPPRGRLRLLPHVGRPRHGRRRRAGDADRSLRGPVARLSTRARCPTRSTRQPVQLRILAAETAPRLELSATGLLGAIGLGLAQRVILESDLAVCANCGRVFRPYRPRPGVSFWCKREQCKRASRVGLDADMVAALRAHKDQAAERLAWGPGWTDTGLVFVAEDGRPYHPQGGRGALSLAGCRFHVTLAEAVLRPFVGC
jgi:hypothetical protein